MKLIIDNIIYSLQKAGGISVVWNELTKRLLTDPEMDLHFLDFNTENIFRKELLIPNSSIIDNPRCSYPTLIQRYLKPKLQPGKGLFHSSYYRTTRTKNIINITTVHDFNYEYYRNGIPRLIHHYQKINAIKNSKKIICISKNTKQDLLKFYPKTKENQIKVIYNGVDDRYQPLLNKDEVLLNQLIPFSSGEFVLYVGDRKSTYKNFNVAVGACKIVNQPLVMIGGGMLTPEENYFLKNQLGNNNFKLLLGIQNEQLNLIYNHAFCLLYPSLYEGFGIPIIESQRAGCPVIGMNLSSIPEVAGKGAILLKKGTALEIADALSQIKSNLAISEKLKIEGFQNAKRFSWDKCYQQTKEVYKEIYQENLQ